MLFWERLDLDLGGKNLFWERLNLDLGGKNRVWKFFLGGGVLGKVRFVLREQNWSLEIGGGF